jgi:hypothetical protein
VDCRLPAAFSHQPSINPAVEQIQCRLCKCLIIDRRIDFADIDAARSGLVDERGEAFRIRRLFIFPVPGPDATDRQQEAEKTLSAGETVLKSVSRRPKFRPCQLQSVIPHLSRDRDCCSVPARTWLHLYLPGQGTSSPPSFGV